VQRACSSSVTNPIPSVLDMTIPKSATEIVARAACKTKRESMAKCDNSTRREMSNLACERVPEITYWDASTAQFEV
jgi:hypothetical protein